ncbi:MAG TPA: GntR family transcriptional regulator [Bryobacteraceae bacterium]|nr:GntR family transcriptional regulator [Bryobacteraceae bacterium]
MTKKTAFGFLLDLRSGVPVYRQIIDQVMAGMASGRLTVGDQLPTVRQVAVDLAINPNTVVRAYRELEIRGVLETQQGTGTFIALKQVAQDDGEHRRRLAQLVSEFVARAGSAGFTVADLKEQLNDL